MKKIIICITIFFISIQTVSAARNNSLAVGVEYSITHSTVKKVQMFTKYAKTLGYSGVTDTIPTITSLQNDYKTYRLNGGILFFAGEGAPQKMYWNYLNKNGQYAVGIQQEGGMCGPDGYDYTGINNFYMNKTDIVIFLGCNTGEGSDNLVTAAKSQGSKVSIGWKEKIYDDAAMWVERFMISLNSGGTINTAIDYANSYLYPHSSSKAYYIALGNASYKNMTLKNLQSQSIVNIRSENERKIYTLNGNYNYSQLEEELKRKFSIENIKDYEVNYTKNESYDIIDYTLLINGFKSQLGYTVFKYPDKIIIYDNTTNEIKQINNYAKNVTTNNNLSFNEAEIIEQVLAQYTEKFNKLSNKKINLESTLKRFDISNNKYYFDINVMITDEVQNTSYISTYSYLIK